MKIGRYLFIDRIDYFRGRGIHEIVSAVNRELYRVMT